MAFAKTGYTENTPKNYVINAASVYTNVTYAEVGGFTGTLIGATSGGVTVTIEQNYMNPEVDGTAHVQGKVKGNTLLESAAARAVVNLKEITAEALRKGLNGSIRAALSTEAPTGYKVVETKREVEASDYLTNIAIVGTLSGSDEAVIAILDNPLCTGGIELATEDNNGGAVIELTYEAHATATQLAAETFPWRILFPTIA